MNGVKIYTDKVSYDKHEGYNPEAKYDTLGSKYFILSIDDFNKIIQVLFYQIIKNLFLMTQMQ